jgi:hypothetical protein
MLCGPDQRIYHHNGNRSQLRISLVKIVRADDMLPKILEKKQMMFFSQNLGMQGQRANGAGRERVEHLWRAAHLACAAQPGDAPPRHPSPDPPPLQRPSSLTCGLHRWRARWAALAQHLLSSMRTAARETGVRLSDSVIQRYCVNCSSFLLPVCRAHAARALARKRA